MAQSSAAHAAANMAQTGTFAVRAAPGTVRPGRTVTGATAERAVVHQMVMQQVAMQQQVQHLQQQIAAHYLCLRQTMRGLAPPALCHFTTFGV